MPNALPQLNYKTNDVYIVKHLPQAAARNEILHPKIKKKTKGVGGLHFFLQRQYRQAQQTINGVM